MFCKTSSILKVTFAIMLLISCAKDDNLLNNISDKINKINTNIEVNSKEDDIIEVSILGKKTIFLSESRIDYARAHDTYGTGQFDNRFELSEIDDILTAIKGYWEIDEYIGFVSPAMYYSELNWRDNVDTDIKENLKKKYREKVEKAKNNIPEICFSIKESYMGVENKVYNSNYIYVNRRYASPISIILSFDRTDDLYSIFADRTTISNDFFVQFPVLYIKFFINNNFTVDYRETIYTPATLVLSADEKFYILIDGAFYSVKSSTYNDINKKSSSN